MADETKQPAKQSDNKAVQCGQVPETTALKTLAVVAEGLVPPATPVNLTGGLGVPQTIASVVSGQNAAVPVNSALPNVAKVMSAAAPKAEPAPAPQPKQAPAKAPEGKQP